MMAALAIATLFLGLLGWGLHWRAAAKDEAARARRFENAFSEMFDRPEVGARLVFDPINLLLQIFALMWPGKRVEIAWVSDLKKDQGVWGCAAVPEGDEPWAVQIDVEAPFHAIIELLAHELAHVAAGQTHDEPGGHGEAWSRAFDELHAEYERRVEQAYRGSTFYMAQSAEEAK